MKHIAIIGAGVRGLASAAILQQRGYAVTIFEETRRAGGIWNRVFPSSTLNTPHFGYTFHPSNRWPNVHATRDDILANIDRLLDTENLRSRLRLATPVNRIRQTPEGRWHINDDSSDFDGVLLCSGTLGTPKMPDGERLTGFGGSISLPYDFDPGALKGEHVVIVGSGATALEMLKLAAQQQAQHTTLLAHPNAAILDIGRFTPLAFAISGHPLFYHWHRRIRSRPVNAAACVGIDRVLALPNVAIRRSAIAHGDGQAVELEDSSQLKADRILWCTGWNTQMPDWAREYAGDPTFVIAACRGCLDSGGFGLGTATAHAKALDAALRFGLEQPFRSGSKTCSCEQESSERTPHIVLNLARYFLSQPCRWQLLRYNARLAMRSHYDRWRHSGEPRLAKLTSFLHTPLGL